MYAAIHQAIVADGGDTAEISYYRLINDFAVPGGGLGHKLRSLTYLGFIDVIGSGRRLANRYRLSQRHRTLNETEALRLLALVREPRSTKAGRPRLCLRESSAAGKP